jgi:hypothetical protein
VVMTSVVLWSELGGMNDSDRSVSLQKWSFEVVARSELYG